MRVLVTGSEGFVGKNLVLALKARGDVVTESDLKVGTNLFQWNVMEAGPFEEIYHLACVNQEEAIHNSYRNLQVNAFAAQVMAKLAARHDARFVYTSTASVYGNQDTFPIRENAPLRPKTDYAVAKLAGEHFVMNSGADYTIFRLSNVYGPHQTTDNPYCGVVAKFIEASKAGKPLQIIGDGTQTRDFTYVDDVIDVLMNFRPNNDDFLVQNVSHGVETPIWELAELISAGKKLVVQFQPERAVDGIQRRVLANESFKIDCPTNLKVGIAKTLQWVDEFRSS